MIRRLFCRGILAGVSFTAFWLFLFRGWELLVVNEAPNDTSEITADDELWLPDEETPKNLSLSPFFIISRRFYAQAQGENVTPGSLTNPDIAFKRIAVIRACENGTIGCLEDLGSAFETCEYCQCTLTNDWTQADAVLFYLTRYSSIDQIPRFPRPLGQIWVMMAFDPPVLPTHFSVLDDPLLKAEFNWTLTYRTDSDILQLHGGLEQLDEPEKDFGKIYSKKHVTAAMFASDCTTQSERLEYVTSLQEIMEVHVYGPCGNHTCGDSTWNLDKNKCFPILSGRYFFILAFEDLLCRDYVTDEFFRAFEDIDVIPVVRGAIDYRGYFPKDVFVDASNFRAPADLAEHLLKLSNNETQYTLMLKEKNRYRRRPVEGWPCQLCKKMFTASSRKWYLNVRSWFTYGAC